MRLIKINLRNHYEKYLDHDVFLNGLLYDRSNEFPNFKRCSVLVLPGGGYQFISYREKDPIMCAFLAEGLNAFSLDYSLRTPYPIPYIEVACALDYINRHANQFDLIENSCSLVGFSAGGHLASTYGYIYKKLAENKQEERRIKPFAIILGYPVISIFKSNNPNCRKQISNNDKKLIRLLSADEHISKDYPPTFIFTTKDDNCVSHLNSIWLRDELKKKKVKNKCIIYKSGPHGLSLANHATATRKEEINEDVEGWLKLASKFIFSL